MINIPFFARGRSRRDEFLGGHRMSRFPGSGVTVGVPEIIVLLQIEP